MSSNMWDILSSEPKEPRGILNDRIIMKFDQFMNWNLLSAHYDFSIDMLRIYMHRVNWHLILKRVKFSDEFLREISPYLTECWSTVSKYQSLDESFIHDFANELDWELVVQYQNAQLMTGLPTSTRAECESALRQLLLLGAGIVIITLGKEGAIFASSEDTEVQHEPGTPVEKPVDTTGAGDMFLGSLAFLLAYRSHWPMKWKVQMSCTLAAHSITKRGTQASFPNINDLPPNLLTDLSSATVPKIK